MGFCAKTSAKQLHIDLARQICAHSSLLPGARVLRHVPLPVALDSELEATFVADKGLHPTVGSHVLLQQSFAQVRLCEKSVKTSEVNVTQKRL